MMLVVFFLGLLVIINCQTQQLKVSYNLDIDGNSSEILHRFSRTSFAFQIDNFTNSNENNIKFALIKEVSYYEGLLEDNCTNIGKVNGVPTKYLGLCCELYPGDELRNCTFDHRITWKKLSSSKNISVDYYNFKTLYQPVHNFNAFLQNIWNFLTLKPLVERQNDYINYLLIIYNEDSTPATCNNIELTEFSGPNAADYANPYYLVERFLNFGAFGVAVLIGVIVLIMMLVLLGFNFKFCNKQKKNEDIYIMSNHTANFGNFIQENNSLIDLCSCYDCFKEKKKFQKIFKLLIYIFFMCFTFFFAYSFENFTKLIKVENVCQISVLCYDSNFIKNDKPMLFNSSSPLESPKSFGVGELYLYTEDLPKFTYADLLNPAQGIESNYHRCLFSQYSYMSCQVPPVNTVDSRTECNDTESIQAIWLNVPEIACASEYFNAFILKSVSSVFSFFLFFILYLLFEKSILYMFNVFKKFKQIKFLLLFILMIVVIVTTVILFICFGFFTLMVYLNQYEDIFLMIVSFVINAVIFFFLGLFLNTFEYFLYCQWTQAAVEEGWEYDVKEGEEGERSGSRSRSRSRSGTRSKSASRPRRSSSISRDTPISATPADTKGAKKDTNKKKGKKPVRTKTRDNKEYQAMEIEDLDLDKPTDRGGKFSSFGKHGQDEDQSSKFLFEDDTPVTDKSKSKRGGGGLFDDENSDDDMFGAPKNKKRPQKKKKPDFFDDEEELDDDYGGGGRKKQPVRNRGVQKQKPKARNQFDDMFDDEDDAPDPIARKKKSQRVISKQSSQRNKRSAFDDDEDSDDYRQSGPKGRGGGGGQKRSKRTVGGGGGGNKAKKKTSLFDDDDDEDDDEYSQNVSRNAKKRKPKTRYQGDSDSDLEFEKSVGKIISEDDDSDDDPGYSRGGGQRNKRNVRDTKKKRNMKKYDDDDDDEEYVKSVSRNKRNAKQKKPKRGGLFDDTDDSDGEPRGNKRRVGGGNKRFSIDDDDDDDEYEKHMNKKRGGAGIKKKKVKKLFTDSDSDADFMRGGAKSNNKRQVGRGGAKRDRVNDTSDEEYDYEDVVNKRNQKTIPRNKAKPKRALPRLPRGKQKSSQGRRNRRNDFEDGDDADANLELNDVTVTSDSDLDDEIEEDRKPKRKKRSNNRRVDISDDDDYDYGGRKKRY